MSATIPLIITNDMKTKLRAQGFGDDEIAKMTPAEAWNLIGGIPQANQNGKLNHSEEPSYPPLPDDIYPVDSFPNPWLKSYVDYAKSVSPMTPESFHESAALWLISTAIARRVKIAMYFGDVYPNIFVLWLASTTLWRKTTALNVAAKIARTCIPHLLAPQDSTPEGLLSDLAGREPKKFDLLTSRDQHLWKLGRDHAAQKGLVVDEFSRILATAGKDYGRGLVETFLKLFDCEPRYTRSTKSDGWIVVRDAYLSLLSATTPRIMSQHLASETLWGNGFWPRFAILTPNGKPKWAKPTNMPDDQPPEMITRRIRNLDDILPDTKWPDTPSALSVQLADGVLAAWEKYNKAVSFDMLEDDQIDERLFGTYGRLPAYVLKVAMLLAVIEWADSSAVRIPVPVMTLFHLRNAIDIVEGWRASAHRALSMADNREQNRLLDRILKQIVKREPGGATTRDIVRAMGDKTTNEIKNGIAQLLREGEISEQKVQTGGRPAIKYRLLKEDDTQVF